MTIVNKLPVVTFDSTSSTWQSHSLPDNQIRLTINFDYNLLDNSKDEYTQNRNMRVQDNPKKYYITYLLGGQIEGKTDMLTPGEAIWTITHDINVTPDLLMNLYQKPSEYIIWEVSPIAKEIKRRAIIKEAPQEPNSAKHAKVVKASSSKTTTNTQPKKNLKMSLANTGVTNKHQLHLKKKPLGKTIQKGTANALGNTKSPKTDANIDFLEAYLQGGSLRRTSSFDEKKFTAEPANAKRRPGSASPVLSRRSSAISSAGRVSPHPHHYNHPEKHVDPTLIKAGLIRSRSSSFSNLMEAARPKTPPSPHHHLHPLKVLQSTKVVKKPTEPVSNKKESAKSATKKESTKTKSVKENLSIIAENETRITWGSAQPSAKPQSNWEKIFQNSEYRKNNDFPVEKVNENALIEKKKGENIHAQIEKVKLDFGVLFFDEMQMSKRSFDIESAEKVIQLHTELNAKQLGIDVSTLEETNLRLKLHSLSTEQLQSIDLQLTNQFFDEQNRIFLFEGQVDGHLKCILKEVQSWNNPHIRILETSLKTSTRNNYPLTAEMKNIRIKPLISHILNQKNTYLLRDIEQDAFNCLDILNQLCTYNGTSAPIPARNMILSLVSSNYATSETIRDSLMCVQTVPQDAVSDSQQLTEQKKLRYLQADNYACEQNLMRRSLQFHNTKQMKILNQRKLREPNYVKLNAMKNYTYTTSFTSSFDTTVFNYSCQKRSSVGQQIEKLRKDLKKDDSCYYTYGRTFLSQMINQSDFPEELKEEDKKSKSKWITKNGFYPG
ncbi:hypothetical protein HDV01_004237 [Terramyces sp. JEL0728]|nr:hypothetical protein HDV01_004237 [Terramyces sp. JEL0728]